MMAGGCGSAAGSSFLLGTPIHIGITMNDQSSRITDRGRLILYPHDDWSESYIQLTEM